MQVAVGDQALLQLREGERLDEVMDGPELHRGADALQVPGGGDHEEVRPLFPVLVGLAQDVEAVAVREIEVEQHQRGTQAVDLAPGRWRRVDA